MTDAINQPSDLPEGAQKQVRAWLQDFEQNWDEGLLPSLVGRLPPPENPLRQVILNELVKIDLQQLQQRGLQADLEAYRQRYPELDSSRQPPPKSAASQKESKSTPGTEMTPVPAPGLVETAPLPEGFLAKSRQGPTIETYQPPQPQRPPTANQISLSDAVPQQMGRYRILRTIGKGGMGRVFLAHDSQLDRQVALKVPFIRQDDGPELLQRFYREARAAATLQHPHICPVYDVGEFEGVPYITMAYIEGKSLTDLIKGGKQLPEREAAQLILVVALAMEEAHQRGVIHRDLKPSNILVNLRGEPVVMDFGVARQINQEGERLTESGRLLGTPEYMAPEQAKGDIAVMGPGSDVYSLGVILYRLLAGRLPFEGPLTQVLVKITTEKPVAPSTYRPGLDPRLEEICKKAMSRRLESRYPSMADLAAALDAYLHNGPQPARSQSPTARLAESADGAGKNSVHSGGTAALTGAARMSGSDHSSVTEAGDQVVVTPTGTGTKRTAVTDTGSRRRRVPLGLWIGAGWLLLLVAAGSYLALTRLFVPVGKGGTPATVAAVVVDDKQARFTHALKAIENQDYDPAIASLSAVIKLDPAYALAYQKRGLAYQLKGDLDKAIEDYAQALKLPGQHQSETYRLRGEAYLARMEDANAVTDLTAAIKADGGSAGAFAARGIAYLRQKRYDDAIQDCNTARRLDTQLRLENELVAAYSARGLIHFNRAEYKQALADFTEALLLDPKNDKDVLYLNLGNVYRATREYNQALTEYMNSWRINPQSAGVQERLTEAYQRLGQEYLNRKSYQEAIDDFTARIAAHPANAWAYYQRGQVYQARGESGDLDRAIGDYTEVQKRALSLAADLPHRLEEAYLQLSESYVNQKDDQKYDHAIADFSKRLKADDKNALALAHRGRAYYLRGRDGDRELALADLNQALALQNNYALVYRYRGDAYAQGHDFDNAGPDFRKALQLNADDIRNWYQYMHWLLERKELGTYRKQCQALLEQFKKEKDPIHLNILAWLCVLLPDTGVSPRRAMELAETAWRTNANEKESLSFLNTLAAACYRAQQYDQAARHLDNILASSTHTGTQKITSLNDAIFVGLTYAQLNDKLKPARPWLTKSQAAIDRLLKDPSLPWQRRVELQYFGQEIESALKKTKP